MKIEKLGPTFAFNEKTEGIPELADICCVLHFKINELIDAFNSLEKPVDTEKLLNCPKCNSKCDLIFDCGRYHVECHSWNCGIKCIKCFATKQEAINAWNTRACEK